jgi:hypothetical protein
LGATTLEAKLPNIINIDEKILLDNINISYNNRKNIDLDIYEELEED